MNLLGEPLSYDFWQAKVYYLYEKIMIGTARANVRIRVRGRVIQVQIPTAITRIIPIRTDKGGPQKRRQTASTEIANLQTLPWYVCVSLA